MKRFLEAMLVDTHLWVAVAAAGLSLFSAHALGLSCQPGPVALVGASTLLIYRVDSWIDADRGSRTRLPELLAALWLLWSWGTAPLAVRWLVGIGVIPCLLYGLPLGCRRTVGGCLRDLPGVKPFFVTGAVTVAVIGVPCLWSRATMSSTTVSVLAASLYALMLCNVTLFDLRDRAHDGERGVATLPVVWGSRRSRQIVAVTALTVGLCQVWFFYAAFLDAATATFLLLAAAATLTCAGSLQPTSSRLRFALTVDGIPVLLGAAALLTG